MPMFDFPITGDVVDADQANGWFFSADSLYTHRQSITGPVSRAKFKRGSGVRLFSTAGTANLDYFGDWFVGLSTALGQEESYGFTSLNARYVVIPGGALSFYNPFEDASAYFSWQITWANDSNSVNQRSLVKFHSGSVGDIVSVHEPTLREVAKSRFPITTGDTQAGLWKDRYYHGHQGVSFSSAGNKFGYLALCADKALQTRIRSVRLDCILVNNR